MRVATIVTALLLAVGANAQRDTVINPAGNTVVVVYTTDADGDPTTSTISTVRAGAGGVVPTTAETDVLTAPTTTTRQTNTRTATQTTTTPRGIVGAPTTTYAPMTATTYYYGDGLVGTWRNSFVPLTAPTGTVPAGTVQELTEYLQSVSNANPAAASANAAAEAANQSGTPGRPQGDSSSASRGSSVAGWSVVVGAIVGVAAIAF